MGFFGKLKTIWNCRKELLLDYKIKIDFIAFQKEWRARNNHNSTVAGSKFDVNKVEVGEATYGTLNIHCWDNPEEHVSIGNYCSIAEDVHFILGGMHPIHRITTFPYKSHVLKSNNVEHTCTNGAIVVEDDVWICYGVTILSGVRIGKGSVIGAKSVIAKNVPPYSIVINGEVKKQRFSGEVIDKIKKIDLGIVKNMKDYVARDHILDTDLSEENIDALLSQMM